MWKITYLHIKPLESRRFFNKRLIRYNPLILKRPFVRGPIFNYFIYNNKIYEVARNYEKIEEVLALSASAASLAKRHDTRFSKEHLKRYRIRASLSLILALFRFSNLRAYVHGHVTK